ncbi:type VII secretion EssA family protein [Sporosarcina sp. FSL K6-1522]|uniref:type VII secretion EssA family protein n=1 Tax=Sporosarcina sp. FSL K6-1522 TaxID=2921554 RepID=UPI00315ADB0C
MKGKMICLTLAAFVSVWGYSSTSGSADSDDSIHDLEPLLYDKLKFKQNTDYLHDNKKVEMKNTIPVKQFDINFDGSKQLPERGDTSYLFQEAERGKKGTVAVRSSEIGLFTIEHKGRKEEAVRKPQDEQLAGTNVRTMVFVGLIAVGILFLFVFLLPKLVNEPAVRTRTVIK